MKRKEEKDSAVVKSKVADDRVVTFGDVENERPAEPGPESAHADEGFGRDGEACGSRTSARRVSRQAVVAIVAAACVVVCAVGAALALGGNGAFQTVEDSASTQSEAVSHVSSEQKAESESSGADAGSRDEAAESSSASEGDSAAAGQEKDSADAARQETSEAAQPSCAGQPAAPAQDAAQSAPEAGPAPAPQPEPAPEADPEEPATQTIALSIDGSAAGGGMVFDGTVDFHEGMTVYDALVATGVSYNARNSAFGMYVSAIGGMAEKDHGPESGWKYSVNGVVVGTSASTCTLHLGDVVRWFYTLTA